MEMMATSTFERKIEINTPESLERLATILSDETQAKPLSVAPYTEEERDRSETLLSRLLSRSKR